MLGRCRVGGYTAFPDVQKVIVLHAISFDKDEVRKRRKKWINFVKQTRAKWKLSRNSSICSKHFTKDDFIRRSGFVDEVSNKPIIPRLKRDDLGINVMPTVHAKAITTSQVSDFNLWQASPRTSGKKCFHFLFKLIGAAKRKLLK